MGMQGLPLQHDLVIVRGRGESMRKAATDFSAGDAGVTSVQPIAQYRSADMVQVDADLVCTARLGLQPDEAEAAEPLHNLVARLGIAAVRMILANRHFVALVRMWANRLADGVAIEFDLANRDGKILFEHPPLLELF